MRFTGLCKFSGKPEDLLKYVSVDLTNGMQNLFSALGTVKLEDLYVEDRVSTMADCPGSDVPEDLLSLTLDQGTWDVWGSALWAVAGATGDPLGQLWIGLESASPVGTQYGQSRCEQDLGAAVHWVQGMCFRRVNLAKRSKVYLGTLALYTGGPVRRLGSIWAFGKR